MDKHKDFYDFKFSAEQTGYFYIALKSHLRRQVNILATGQAKPFTPVIIKAIKTNKEILEKIQEQLTDKEIKLLDKHFEMVISLTNE